MLRSRISLDPQFEKLCGTYYSSLRAHGDEFGKRDAGRVCDGRERGYWRRPEGVRCGLAPGSACTASPPGANVVCLGPWVRAGRGCLSLPSAPHHHALRCTTPACPGFPPHPTQVLTEQPFSAGPAVFRLCLAGLQRSVKPGS